MMNNNRTLNKAVITIENSNKLQLGLTYKEVDYFKLLLYTFRLIIDY